MENLDLQPIFNQIDEVGIYIAEKLAIPTDIAMETLMLQVRYELVIACIWFGVFALLTTIFNVAYIKNSKKIFEDDEIGALITIILAIYDIVVFAPLVINGGKAIQIAINPNWYLVQMLGELIN